MIASNVVKDINKNRITLSIYFSQFYADKAESPEHNSIEKEISLIKIMQELPVFLFQNGFKLIYISHQKHLFSAKRFAHVAAIHP